MQVIIMLAIGVAAGTASFTHVHDVAASHGQPGWLAWADAVVLELMSIASGLELRRRKRASTSTRFPAAVLAVAVFLSVSAQVVEAERSVIGWIAAAIPALGFLAMVKVALAQAHKPGETVAVPAKLARCSCAALPPAREPVAVVVDEDPILLAAARTAASALDDHGRRVSRQALADVLRADGHAVSNARASALLRTLKAEAEREPPGTQESRRFHAKPRSIAPAAGLQ